MPDRMPPLDTSRRTLEPLLGSIRKASKILRVDPEVSIKGYLETDRYAELVKMNKDLWGRVSALPGRKFLRRKKYG